MVRAMQEKRDSRRKNNRWNGLWNDIFLKNASVYRFYEQLIPPSNYYCANCKAYGVRLWRMSCSSWINLLCLSCAEKDQNNFCKFSEKGKQYIEEFEKVRAGRQSFYIDTPELRALHMNYIKASTDQIGSYVPAVPDETLTTYYGYTSVPQPGVEWWYRLPLRMN